MSVNAYFKGKVPAESNAGWSAEIPKFGLLQSMRFLLNSILLHVKYTFKNGQVTLT